MPSMMNTAIFGLLATAAQVAAHGFIDEIKVDGTSFIGYDMKLSPYIPNPAKSIGWSETSKDLGFVAPNQFTSGDIICHNGAQPGQLTAPVKAGGDVELHWNTWAESHHGPVINYLANCNGDCSTVDKATLKWFKISESGLLDNSFAPGRWASDELMDNGLTGSVKIPTSIADGNYVLRHEMIALHSANNPDGAQNYPFCINLKVSGGGSATPEGVLGTSLYTPTDAGILVNIYNAGLKYEIPGPALFKDSESTAPVASPPAAPVAAPQVTSAPVASAPPTTFVTAIKPSTTFSATPIATPAPVEEQPAEEQPEEESEDGDSCE